MPTCQVSIIGLSGVDTHPVNENLGGYLAWMQIPGNPITHFTAEVRLQYLIDPNWVEQDLDIYPGDPLTPYQWTWSMTPTAIPPPFTSWPARVVGRVYYWNPDKGEIDFVQDIKTFTVIGE